MPSVTAESGKWKVESRLRCTAPRRFTASGPSLHSSTLYFLLRYSLLGGPLRGLPNRTPVNDVRNVAGPEHRVHCGQVFGYELPQLFANSCHLLSHLVAECDLLRGRREIRAARQAGEVDDLVGEC